jgi:hypothetical protein
MVWLNTFKAKVVEKGHVFYISEGLEFFMRNGVELQIILMHEISLT